MPDAHSITADALEILVSRELRKAGIEPGRLQRRSVASGSTTFSFDLVGPLSAYGHRWTTLIECRNKIESLRAEDIDALHQRARDAKAGSAMVFTTSAIEMDALQRASALRIASVRVVDSQQALAAAGVIEGSQMPAWVPEFAAQLIWDDGITARTQLLKANNPESILRLLRPPA